MSNSLATYVKHTGFIVLVPDVEVLMCEADCEVKGYWGENEGEEKEEAVSAVFDALFIAWLPSSCDFTLLWIEFFAFTELCTWWVWAVANCMPVVVNAYALFRHYITLCRCFALCCRNAWTNLRTLRVVIWNARGIDEDPVDAEADAITALLPIEVIFSNSKCEYILYTICFLLWRNDVIILLMLMYNV